MSISASIDIDLKQKSNQNISTTNILDVLLTNGWTILHDGTISYIPLGDKECSDWQINSLISFSDLRNLIIEKEKAHEVNGLILTWENTKSGGIFLFGDNNNSLSFIINLTRKVLKLQDGCEITDFLWYLEKILPPLNHAFGIELFSFEEQK
jgi:hypothetical protein